MRRARIVVPIVVVVLVVVVAVVWWATKSDDDSTAPTLDRHDAQAVASEYAIRFVAENPLVCDLADTTWRDRLDSAGKCSGHTNPSDPKPSATVRSLTNPTPDTASVVVQAGPQKLYPGDACVHLDMQRSGDQWAVTHSKAPLMEDPQTCAG